MSGASPSSERPRTVASPDRYRWWALAFAVASIDLGVKAGVSAWLPSGIVVPVTDFFNLVHVWNPGAAFSFLADAGGWQRWFFIALALAVSAVLLWWLRRPLRRVDALAYSLITGGALGNAMDRIVRGHVVDYLDFHAAGLHWPAFNVADIAITSAAALLIASAFTQRQAAPVPPSGQGVAR